MAMSRRFFLKSSGLAAASLASLTSMPKFLLRASSLRDALDSNLSASQKRKILIAIFQRGAADGLNIVVPFAEQNYYRLRPTIAIPAPKAGDATTAIDLDGFFALHPSLEAFKPLYDAKHLAIIHAAGSPDNTRSHFDAQDFMESGTPGVKSTPDGWLNRIMQTQRESGATPFRGIALSPQMPRSLYGSAPTVALANVNDFGIRAGKFTDAMTEAFETLYAGNSQDAVRATGAESFEAVQFLKKANPQQFQPENGAVYPNGPLGNSLKQIAQLIKSNVGMEIAFTDIGGWDHHVGEGNVQGQLANRLREFSQAIAALYTDLGDRMEDIVILTMSEFGRTTRENGNRGTDHGHANCMFVLGGNVKGGKVYGQWPGLDERQLYENRDLALTTDFRDVFSEIVSKHLGCTNLSRVFPGYDASPGKFRNFIRA
ncbi:MAG: DUF1501 domain-containing protein [Acidobacteriia bacterium]|nr:DUF1501 domain-containing protein [Terriglobia bacterium]